MSEETGLKVKILREMADFQKTMDELRMLKLVSRDLNKFKKMIKLKKFD
jgi:hypothetical protein